MRAVIRREELLKATLNLGGPPITLEDYATTGLRIVTVGPSGIGKTNAGLLVAEQLSEQGWVSVLVDPEGEIESMYGKALTPEELATSLEKRDQPIVVISAKDASEFIPYAQVILAAADTHRKPLFVMLNPSTADGLKDDPTIRRCLGFASDWGFRHMQVVNLFAWRATYPKDMLKQLDPVGPHGDEWILRATEVANLIICAWGAKGGKVVNRRADQVKNLLHRNGRELHNLGTSKAGQPFHPLMLVRETKPVHWPVSD